MCYTVIFLERLPRVLLRWDRAFFDMKVVENIEVAEVQNFGTSMNIRNQVMESESSRFKISTYFNKFNWTVPYTLKQKAEPSFKSHPVESSESFISEPSVVFQGLTFTFSIKKSVAHERSFTCFLQILSPDFRTAGFRHPLQCSASASSLGLRLLLIRALLYWLPLPVASSEGSKKDAHTQSAEELVTLLSESRVNHRRRSTSQYNLMMRSDFHDSFWTPSIIFPCLDRHHTGWSGFSSPDKCFFSLFLTQFQNLIPLPLSPNNDDTDDFFMHVLNFA